MVLHIKNMVCSVCIKVVNDQLMQLGYKIKHIELGLAELSSKINEGDIRKIKRVLSEYGFQLIENENERITAKLKTLVINLIYSEVPDTMNVNFSEYLSEKLNISYGRLSKLFSSIELITIEKFIINHKIERVKELLTYDELSLNEISHKLNYSSMQHLSNQFKRVTGLTPSEFKKTPTKKRVPINKL